MGEGSGFVYHYTSAETASDFILKNKSLKMGSLASVNDPKETKFRDFVFYARGAKSMASFQSARFDRIISDLTSRTFAFCAGTESSSERAGVDGALRSHMWANYANRHRGVCLVFDKEALHARFELAANGRKLYSGEVRYYSLDEYRSETIPAYSIYFEDWLKDERGYLDYHIFYYHTPLFFSKYSGWRDEHEYRWVLRGDDDKGVFADFEAALVKVVVGSDICPDMCKKIFDWCCENDVPIHRVLWNAAGNLSSDLRQDKVELGVDIQGSYSRSVCCSALVMRATNALGGFESVAVSAKNGYVCILDSNADEVSIETLISLGFTDEDLGVEIEPKGFSAARLADTYRRPLKFEPDGSGGLKISLEEEKVYYG